MHVSLAYVQYTHRFIFQITAIFFIMETRRGLFTKLALFSSVAIGIYVVGKKHIAHYKDQRHRNETDARIDSSGDEFRAAPLKPGFPTAENLEYQRESKYVGAGNAYASRKPGDRFAFTLSSIFEGKK